MQNTLVLRGRKFMQQSTYLKYSLNEVNSKKRLSRMTLHIFTLSVEPRILKTRERKEKKEKKLSFSGSLPEVFYKKVFLKILQNSQENTCARQKQPFRKPMPKCDFIEIALRHGCSPVNLLHIFRTHFPKNTPGWLVLARASFLIKLQV